MTRLAVLSDIHGNLPALQAVLEDASHLSLDGFIQAGDYTAGPQVTECLQIQRCLPGWMIRGNGEVNLRRYETGECPSAWKSDHQFSLLRWDYARLSRAERYFLFSLPEQRVVQIEGCDPIRVVHGSPSNPYEQIFLEDRPTLERALAATREPVLVCGHTHRPWALRQDGKLALNPGAVCGPLNGFIGAQYAILSWQADGWQVQHREVCYDMAAVRGSFEDSGLLAASGALGKLFLLSIENGQDIARLFLDQAYRLTEQAGYKNPKTVPDEIWDSLDLGFDWQAAFLDQDPIERSNS
jgi:putative phosphoesterase